MNKLLSVFGLSFVLLYSTFSYSQTERFKCYVTYKKNKAFLQKVIEIDAWGPKSLKKILKNAEVYDIDGLTRYPIKKVHECTKVSLAFEGESALEVEKNLPR